MDMDAWIHDGSTVDAARHGELPIYAQVVVIHHQAIAA
jgi:hypothetical protein